MGDFITNEFETSSAAAWKQKIQFELNGADFNETLLTKTNEGITIKPFYHSDDFVKLNIPTSKESFKICNKIIITSENETNLNAISAINKGVNSLKFEASKPFNPDVLFKNLLNKNIVFHFQLRFISEEFINKIAKFLKNETVFFNIDIIGNLAKTGNWYTSLNNDFKSIENIIQLNLNSNILSVNVNLYQNAGANTVQQVAYALAHANEYLTRFGEKIANHIQFNFATGSNYFFEIAKIRAFRYLWNLILNEYNCKAEAKIFSEPSLRNKTIFDLDRNLLRINTENLSAAFGGANTISNNTLDTLNKVIHFKKDLGSNNPQEMVNDSYFIESITKQIAEKALLIFKEIEKSGGFLNQLKEGTIQRKITENTKKEQVQFNNSELVLVGANKYKNNNKTIDSKSFKTIERKKHKTLIIPIIPKRLSEKLEQKQLKNEA